MKEVKLKSEVTTYTYWVSDEDYEEWYEDNATNIACNYGVDINLFEANNKYPLFHNEEPEAYSVKFLGVGEVTKEHPLMRCTKKNELLDVQGENA